METRKIGSLEVSVVGLGCNQLGPTVSKEETVRLVDAAFDAGVNFFDTADEYGPDGVSEEYLGAALRGRREDAVIATKFGHHMQDDPARGGASARWIEQAVEDSLRRLGTDRIDLYQQHFPDPAVRAEETMTALDRLVRAGKVREIGCCNLDADDVTDRAKIADAAGLTQLASAQNRLNLLRQEARTDLVPTLEQLGMVLLPFFPLAAGMLTGKYRRNEPPPNDSRFARINHSQAEHMINRDADRVALLEAWAREHGHPVAELAVAWLVAQPIVASVIAGATRPEQVRANAGAAAWRLTPEDLAELEGLAASQG